MDEVVGSIPISSTFRATGRMTGSGTGAVGLPPGPEVGNAGRGWPSRHLSLVLLCVIVLGGLGLRLYRLGDATPTEDEAWTYIFANEPPARLWGPDGKVETNPPIYYALQRAWLTLGDSMGAMRSLPLVFGVVSIGLMYWAAHPLVGRGGALIAASMLAVTEIHVHYSQQARAYAMLTCWVLVMLGCVVRILPRRALHAPMDPPEGTREFAERSAGGRAMLWAGYVASGVLTVYSHNTAVLVPMMIGLYVGGLWIARRIPTRHLMAWIAASLAIGAAYGWWMLRVLYHVEHIMPSFWAPPATLARISGQLQGVYAYPPVLKYVALGALALGLVALRKRPAIAALSMWCIVGQPAILVLLSQWLSVFLIRVLVWPNVVFCATAGAIAGLARGRWVFVVVLVGMTALQAGMLPRQYMLPTNSDLEALAAPWSAYDPQRDRVLLAPVSFEPLVRYHTRRSAPRFEGVGVMYADAPRQLERFHWARPTPRAEAAGAAAASLGEGGRLWVLRERRSLVRRGEGEGFEALWAELFAAFRPTEHHVSGNFELLVCERVDAGAGSTPGPSQDSGP